VTPWFGNDRLHFAAGIEDTSVPQKDVGRRKLDEYELTQNCHQRRDDLTPARDAGAGVIRWGVPWYLPEPAPGRLDFTWTDQVVAHLDRIGLRCVVDLVHCGTKAERAAATGAVRPAEAGTAGPADLPHLYADRYEQPLRDAGSALRRRATPLVDRFRALAAADTTQTSQERAQ
jgi:hypothetical protein